MQNKKPVKKSIKKPISSSKQSKSKINSSKTKSSKLNFIDSIKNYFLINEEKIKQSKRLQFTFFILLFLVFFLFFSIILTPFQIPIKQFTGKTIESILSLQGIKTNFIGLVEIETGEIVYSFDLISNGLNQQFFISWLCTGIFEIIILCGAIFASIGIKSKEKLNGILLAIIVGVIFNFIRIILVINIYLLFGLNAENLTHDILFRLFLFIYITLFYVVWFN
ncbi:MAG: exosortase/archaeosortase family protein, partial [Candidatus ainarchaeum sp.]|nr:exosortase/archaeosortase family protein [Candidatus ainarchaeum sp.]